MLNNIGPTEVVIVAVIILILFGGKKLPEMGRGLGESFKEFKKAVHPNEEAEDKEEKEEEK